MPPLPGNLQRLNTIVNALNVEPAFTETMMF